MSVKVNVGCGMTVTEGWVNLDNSFSLILARFPWLVIGLLHRAGLLEKTQYDYIKFAKEKHIMRADASRKLPFENQSVEVIYSSHMLEHLDRQQAQSFLREVYRVMQPGGIIRIAVPDIKRIVEVYLNNGDAHQLIESMDTCADKPTTLLQKLKYAWIGPRHHHWMYDGQSLCRLLLDNGFEEVVELAPNQTTLPDPGHLNLAERVECSIFVEARKPGLV